MDNLTVNNLKIDTNRDGMDIACCRNVRVSDCTVSPANGSCAVPVTNHYSFTDLQELTCRRTALNGSTTLRTGIKPISCGPMQSTTASFPAPAGMTALRLELLHPDGTSVIAYNLAVDGVPLPAAPPAPAPGGALAAQDGPDVLSVRSALQQIAFDKHTGAVQSWRVGGRDVLTGGPTLNLGEGKGKNKGGDDNGIYRADGPPVTTDAQVSATPGAGGAMRVAVTSTVLAAGGAPLGTLATTYDIALDAQMTVHWTLNWTAADVRLWEDGLKFALPAGMTRMAWQRDSFFTDYPAGHLGEPSGTAPAGETLFRASKRGLHWLTLSDGSGAGLALLAADTPLLGRADPASGGVTLFASREASGDYGLSRQWVDDHTIRAVKGRSLSGAFALRAISAPGRAAALK